MNGRFLPSPVDQVVHDPNGPPPSLHGHYPLHRYYEAVRPCSVFRYFRPRGSSPRAFSLCTTKQVLKFRTRAKTRVTPPLVVRKNSIRVKVQRNSARLAATLIQ